MEGIARKMRNAAWQFVRRVGNSVREKDVYRDGRHESILISATIGRDSIGNEAALQLSPPVWECNTESLIQVGV